MGLLDWLTNRDKQSPSRIYREIEKRKETALAKAFMERGALIRRNLGDDKGHFQDEVLSITSPGNIDGFFDFSESCVIKARDGTTLLAEVHQDGYANSILTYLPGEWESHFERLF